MKLENLFPHADLVYFIITMVWYLVATVVALWGFRAALRAWRRFLAEKMYDKLTVCYALCNQLFRTGLSVQRKVKAGDKYEVQPLIEALNDLRNWWFDHRFLFAGKHDQKLGQMVELATNEARHIAATCDMTRLRELQSHLERRLAEPF